MNAILPALDGVPWETARSAPAGFPAPSAEVLVTPEALAQLGPDWSALFERAALPHQIFQSHPFLTHWAAHYLDGKASPFIVTVRRQGRLDLVWPLVRRRVAGLDVLLTMGAPLAQFEDLVADRGPGLDRLLQAAWQAARGSGADLLIVRRLRADSVLGRLTAGPKLVLSREAAPFVDLALRVGSDGPGQAYSAKERSAYRRRLRRLSELGTVALKSHTPGPKAAALATQAVAYKRDWLRRSRVASRNVSDPRFGAFFAAIAAEPASALRVSTIEIDGEAVGVDLSFDCRGTTFGHVIASRPCLEKEGIGSVLVHHVFAAARARGIGRFDMLSPADPYKLRHADGITAVEDIAYPFSRAGRLCAATALKRGLPLAKSLIRHMPPLFAGRAASPSA